MKIWFDTEFIEDGKTIDLISIGMVREDGKTLYRQNEECDLNRASAWVKDNVFPHLDSGAHNWHSRAQIASAIVEFAGEEPVFWAYYADYDWVALCQLFGTMMQLPKGWPMFCMDLKQVAVMLGDPKLPEQTDGEHHALFDALWTRKAWNHLRSFERDVLGRP